jgi:hypothetical protein
VGRVVGWLRKCISCVFVIYDVKNFVLCNGRFIIQVVVCNSFFVNTKIL